MVGHMSNKHILRMSNKHILYIFLYTYVELVRIRPVVRGPGGPCRNLCGPSSSDRWVTHCRRELWVGRAWVEDLIRRDMISGWVAMCRASGVRGTRRWILWGFIMYTGYGDNAHPDFSVSIPFPIERVGECWSWPKRLLLPHGLFRPSGYSDIHGVFVHHTRTYNLQNHKIKHLFNNRQKHV